jgi:CCR4-NOT transcription complex subunit 7/8
MSNGFLFTRKTRFTCSHLFSGYDFGYLLKLLTCTPLPSEEADFFHLLSIYFPCIYDIKYMMKSCKNLKGGLQDVADELDIPRIGPQHQAGSDSLLTSNTFFRMCQIYFDNQVDDAKYLGYLYGFNCSTKGLPVRQMSNLSLLDS